MNPREELTNQLIHAETPAIFRELARKHPTYAKKVATLIPPQHFDILLREHSRDVLDNQLICLTPEQLDLLIEINPYKTLRYRHAELNKKQAYRLGELIPCKTLIKIPLFFKEDPVTLKTMFESCNQTEKEDVHNQLLLDPRGALQSTLLPLLDYFETLYPKIHRDLQYNAILQI